MYEPNTACFNNTLRAFLQLKLVKKMLPTNQDTIMFLRIKRKGRKQNVIRTSTEHGRHRPRTMKGE